MDLFTFYEIKETSIIDKVQSYIENKNIRHLSLSVDYSDIEIIDLWEEEPTLKKYFRHYGGKCYSKGFNYKIYKIFSQSEYFEDFINSVRINISEKRAIFLQNNFSSLEQIKKYIRKPERLLVIEADTKEEVKEIATTLHTLQSNIKNNPELLNRRIIKKVCNVSDKKEEIGLKIEELF